MKLISAEEIKISPNRQRREFDVEKISELADSIQSKGLLHAPVLRKDGTLVAGERRLRAISFIQVSGGTFSFDGEAVPSGQVPFVSLDDLDALDLEEAELEENTVRQDLTWQERAEATSRLHNLRKAQALSIGASTHTATDTALEVNGSLADSRAREEVRASILLADKMHLPEVAKAKSAKEGLKALRAIETREKNTALGESVGRMFSAASHSLLNDSMENYFANTADSQFDLILTDPPYGMGADDFNDAGGALGTLTHEYQDDAEYFQRIMDVFVPESIRVTKPQAHLYLFCDIEKFALARDLLRIAGWRVHRTPLIWTKPHAHRVPWPEHGPRRQWEMILYAVKGQKRVNYIGSDVIESPLDTNLGLAAQKPAALFAELLNRSCVPGDRVLDPFCGTGTIFEAAHGLKVAATGVEMNPATYGIAAQRLGGLK